MSFAAKVRTPRNLPDAAQRAKVGLGCFFIQGEALDVAGRQEVQADACSARLAAQVNARAYTAYGSIVALSAAASSSAQANPEETPDHVGGVGRHSMPSLAASPLPPWEGHNGKSPA
jgi:hypothetical protein